MTEIIRPYNDQNSTLANTILSLTLVHLLALRRFMALPLLLTTVPILTEASLRVATAGTVCVVFAFISSCHDAAPDNTVSEYADTAGIRYLLATSIVLAVSGEFAATNRFRIYAGNCTPRI